MAYDHDGYCRVCEKETNHSNGRCRICRENDIKTEEAVWMSQTVDERLLDIHRRLKDMTRGPFR